MLHNVIVERLHYIYIDILCTQLIFFRNRYNKTKKKEPITLSDGNHYRHDTPERQQNEYLVS